MSRPAQSPGRAADSPLPWLILALLAAATVAAFWPTFHCQFINFDDEDYVTENWAVRSGLTWRGLAWAFSSSHVGNWHPLTGLSHMLDCQLFGVNPLAHHATSLLLHTLNSLLLFWILRRMTGALWRSAFVAALFALHPIHVESVAWVSERKDVLSTFFGLLAIWAYAAYAKAERGGQQVESRKQKAESRIQKPVSRFTLHALRLYLLSLLLFACGLMSKPMLVSLPFVLLLLDYWPLQRLRLKTQDSRLKTLLPLFREKLPFFALSLASCVVTFLVQRKAGAVSGLSALPLDARYNNAAVSYLRYTRKLLCPNDLALPYPLVSWELWQGLGAILLLLIVSVMAVRWGRRWPYLAVGWLWFVGTLVPVIGLVQVGVQSMADRYAYVPSVGFFIMVSWGGYDLLRRWRAAPLVLAAAGVGALLASAWVTRMQLRYWQDSATLFTRALAVTGDDYAAHERLGEALFRQQRFAEAESHLRIALQLAPQLPEAHYSLGRVLVAVGRPAEAIPEWRTALQMKPGWLPVMNNFAWLLATCPDPACRDPAEAVRLAEKACAGDPWNPSFYFDTLAAAYAAAGRFADASVAARKAIALAHAQGDNAAAARFRSRLELYQAGNPYREARP